MTYRLINQKPRRIRLVDPRLNNMTEKNGLTLTQKELLIRIDERQKNILEEIKQIKNMQSRFVRDDDEYKLLVKRVSTLWDMRNKIVGYAAGAGGLGALLFQITLKIWPK